MRNVRPPAVAGMFYPADPATLRRQVAGHLAAATPRGAGTARVKAVIAPHAGYVYSGPTAGFAFAQLARGRRPRSAASCCSGRPTGWRCAASGCRTATPSRRRWARCRWPPSAARADRRPAAGGPSTPRRTSPSTRSRSSCRFCRSCWATSRCCRWSSAMRRGERGRGGARGGLGRRRDAHRDQLGPVALPALRPGVRDRRRDRAGDRRARGAARARPRLRRAADRRAAGGGASARPERAGCSICATPATPPATAAGWSATAPSTSGGGVTAARGGRGAALLALARAALEEAFGGAPPPAVRRRPGWRGRARALSP